jgi:ribonuclease Z
LRRFLVPLLVLAILVAMTSVFLRGPIALRIMQAALERNMTLDPIAELDNGLHAILCGAGGPLPDPDRSGPCVAIVAGEDVYVVDAGSGAARRLARLGIRPSRVEAVLLTHFHSDHIDGLGELGVLRWTAGSHVEPLPVHGPEGVRKVTEGLDQAYRLDAIYRTAHHGPEVTPPTGSGLRAMAFAQPPDGESTLVFERDGLRVTAFRVDHSPVRPAVGYRFDHAGRSIVVSGDTKKSANLERFARGVDLLIHEALSPELMGVIQHAAENVGNRSMAAIAQDVLDYHTSPVEAAESAEAVGAGHLLYYHIVPPMPIPGLASVFLDGVSQAYRGGVTLGRDGTMISLPAASEEIRVVQR